MVTVALCRLLCFFISNSLKMLSLNCCHCSIFSGKLVCWTSLALGKGDWLLQCSSDREDKLPLFNVHLILLECVCVKIENCRINLALLK